VKPKTVEDYEGAIRRLKKAFGTRKVAELSPSDVARLIGQMKGQGLKTWTVRKTLTPLRMAYAVAVREGWVSSSPVDKLLPSETPKGDASEKRCLSRAEIDALLAHTLSQDGRAENPRWKALFGLLCYTGLRISEALALTWNDVTETSVIVREGKTESAAREVILIPAARSLLAAWKLKQAPGVDFVFGTSPGRSCGRREALTALQATCKRAGIPNYTLHELRHTFASIQISLGRSLPWIASQMGHKDAEITLSTYAHLYHPEEETAQAIREMQAAMGGMV
jgi:integrase